MIIKRKLTDEICRSQKDYPVIAITGPRQSGKTTLLKFLAPNRAYANLEDLHAREFAQSDPVGFLQQFPNGAILDEIQRVPQLMSQMQVIVDEKQEPGFFIRNRRKTCSFRSDFYP